MAKGFDKKSFLSDLGKKADKAEAEGDEEATADEEKEPTSLRPGKQLLAAIKANDPEAIEEAVKACHEDYEE